jgi:hypothetical protein
LVSNATTLTMFFERKGTKEKKKSRVENWLSVR